MNKRYRSNDGWLNVKLPLDVDKKLREMAQKTRLTFTAIVANGIEHEWKEWRAVGWKVSEVEKEQSL